MTIEETKKLLITINAIYPNWKVENPEATTMAWHWALEEYPADVVNAALQIFLKTDKAGFVPSVSQLIGCMHKPTENDQLSEGEAWALVKKAIQNGNYHAEEGFDALPPLVQRAVGGAGMIRQWAQTDSDEVNTVVMSNFQRSYKAILSKQDFNNRVPTSISDVVKQVAEKVSPQARLTDKEDDDE